MVMTVSVVNTTHTVLCLAYYLNCYGCFILFWKLKLCVLYLMQCGYREKLMEVEMAFNITYLLLLDCFVRISMVNLVINVNLLLEMANRGLLSITVMANSGLM